MPTGATPVGTPYHLVEVYPHPALITLTRAGGSLPYKVSRSRRYWPKNSPAERRAKLLTQFAEIVSALKGEVRDIPIELPEPDIEHQRRGGADIGNHETLCAPLGSREREPSSAARTTGASPSCRRRRSGKDRPGSSWRLPFRAFVGTCGQG